MLSGQPQCIGRLVFFLVYADSLIVIFKICIPIQVKHPPKSDTNKSPLITDEKKITAAVKTSNTTVIRLILSASFSI
jgi:hypothetical protein